MSGGCPNDPTDPFFNSERSMERSPFPIPIPGASSYPPQQVNSHTGHSQTPHSQSTLVQVSTPQDCLSQDSAKRLAAQELIRQIAMQRSQSKQSQTPQQLLLLRQYQQLETANAQRSPAAATGFPQTGTNVPNTSTIAQEPHLAAHLQLRLLEQYQRNLAQQQQYQEQQRQQQQRQQQRQQVPQYQQHQQNFSMRPEHTVTSALQPDVTKTGPDGKQKLEQFFSSLISMHSATGQQKRDAGTSRFYDDGGNSTLRPVATATKDFDEQNITSENLHITSSDAPHNTTPDAQHNISSEEILTSSDGVVPTITQTTSNSVFKDTIKNTVNRDTSTNSQLAHSVQNLFAAAAQYGGVLGTNWSDSPGGQVYDQTNDNVLSSHSEESRRLQQWKSTAGDSHLDGVCIEDGFPSSSKYGNRPPPRGKKRPVKSTGNNERSLHPDARSSLGHDRRTDDRSLRADEYNDWVDPSKFSAHPSHMSSGRYSHADKQYPDYPREGSDHPPSPTNPYQDRPSRRNDSSRRHDPGRQVYGRNKSVSSQNPDRLRTDYKSDRRVSGGSRRSSDRCRGGRNYDERRYDDRQPDYCRERDDNRDEDRYDRNRYEEPHYDRDRYEERRNDRHRYEEDRYNERRYDDRQPDYCRERDNNRDEYRYDRNRYDRGESRSHCQSPGRYDGLISQEPRCVERRYNVYDDDRSRYNEDRTEALSPTEIDGWDTRPGYNDWNSSKYGEKPGVNERTAYTQNQDSLDPRSVFKNGALDDIPRRQEQWTSEDVEGRNDDCEESWKGPTDWIKQFESTPESKKNKWNQNQWNQNQWKRNDVIQSEWNSIRSSEATQYVPRSKRTTNPSNRIVSDSKTRTYRLVISMPINLTYGKVKVTKTNGENFYVFDELHSAAKLIFSPNEGVCDAWASFLQIKLGQINNVKADEIVRIVSVFHSVMRAPLPSVSDSSSPTLLFATPLKLRCCGIKVSTDELQDEDNQQPSHAVWQVKQKPGNSRKLETRGFPDGEESEHHFRALCVQLKRFSAALGGNIELNEDEILDEGDLESVIQEYQQIVRSDSNAHPGTRPSTGQHPSEISVSLSRFVLDEKLAMTEGLPILVNEYGDVENKDLENSLMNDRQFAEMMTVKDVEVSEIRLAHKSKKMVDPRFAHHLVLTRQMAGDEDLQRWNDRQVHNDTHPIEEIPNIENDAVVENPVVGEQPLNASTLRIGRYVFCPSASIPQVEVAYSDVKNCLASKHGFIYKRHILQMKR